MVKIQALSPSDVISPHFITVPSLAILEWPYLVSMRRFGIIGQFRVHLPSPGETHAKAMDNKIVDHELPSH